MTLRILPACCRILLVALLLTVAALFSPQAQQPASPNGQMQLWDEALNAIERKLTEEEVLLPGDSLDYQATLNAIIANAGQLKKAESDRLPALKTQIQSIGPAPEEGQPKEDPAIAKKRQQLINEIKLAEGRVKQSDLAIARAGELLDRIGLKEQAQISQQLLSQGPSPLLPETWQRALTQDLAILQSLRKELQQWWQSLQDQQLDKASIFTVIAILVFAGILAFPLRRWILRHWGPDPGNDTPSYTRRLAAALAVACAQVLLPILVVIALTALFYSSTDQDFPALDKLALRIGGHVSWFFAATGLAISAFSPRLPAWRIMPVPAQSSGLLASQVIAGSGFILALGLMTVLLSDPTTHLPGVHLYSLIVLAAAIVATTIFMPALRSKYWELDTGRLGLRLSRVVRALAFLAIIVSLVAAIFGYANLAKHLLFALAASAILIGTAFLLRSVLFEGIRAFLAPNGRFFRKVSATTGLTPESGQRLAFWCKLLVEVLLWPPVVYVLLIAYGSSPSLLNTWVARAITGVSIGSVTISLIDLLAALLTVIIGFFVVGAVRRWMRETIMPNTRFDRGLQNSISTGVGYIGGAIVLLIAVVLLGIDLTNIALVAGALSVGIGFSLKTVVENFVAGILLLIERPIKAGDWIVVGNEEGIVKSISIRSTEIETFDRSSVILPNSALIANAVTNWTHKNRIARVIVKVTVALGNDPRKVEELMIRCGTAHPQVMKQPAPSVILRSIGTALSFELRCFVSDTDYYLRVLSDLNYAIFDTFEKESIKLPA